jgi:hypothetical protein
MKRGSMSDSRMSSGHSSALIAMLWRQVRFGPKAD